MSNLITPMHIFENNYAKKSQYSNKQLIQNLYIKNYIKKMTLAKNRQFKSEPVKHVNPVEHVKPVELVNPVEHVEHVEVVKDKINKHIKFHNRILYNSKINIF